MQHINAVPLPITANGTTAVPADYTPSLIQARYIEVYNSDTTNTCFVQSGLHGSVTATTTSNIVPPGTVKTFVKSTTDTSISIVMSAASTKTIYVIAGSSTQFS